ncbi:MAG: hypothetical protein A3F42_08600 [Gammaproteobacteria bacterium RIFCSPHIGHO2_12_FULL_37_34]|nr:MAG: hypothetical protein A3F42_08600 [Gammaproteobacteria bacterium RIFCSPHIGHO2_12_FULL_37_34]
MKKSLDCTQQKELHAHLLDSLYKHLEEDMRKRESKIISLERMENYIKIYYSPDFLGTYPTFNKTDKTRKSFSRNNTNSVVLEIRINEDNLYEASFLSSVDHTALIDTLDTVKQYLIHAADLKEDQLEISTPISLEETHSITFFKLKADEKENEHVALIESEDKKTKENRCCDLV